MRHRPSEPAGERRVVIVAVKERRRRFGDGYWFVNQFECQDLENPEDIKRRENAQRAADIKVP